ncbi:hypothetical protein H8E77_33495 [bacterium]|nr:hypothetical protein [bacterium]
MKRFWVIGLVSLLALGVVGFSLAHSQWGTSMIGRGHTNWHTPMMEHGDSNGNTHMMGRGWNNNRHRPMMTNDYCMGNWADHGWYGTTESLTETEALTKELEE